ncbi:phage major tail tube protein [Pseudoalteromonas sp. MMG012]|uniref:phage major tail tube protein n=1 Tax=Pseudoalteromonas sp. MMG012 TaxID=2822686 RepID=UPI001B3A59C9|nr:phage major tail tube protein [Pseudoalteromonas sp. MMG012]MBQ4852691.1 phage major tail tube protein [Pseudoalteromonas sp. MMG012]
MAVQLPNTLKDFNVFIDGEGYGGRGVSIQLPKLTRITEDYMGSGLAGPIELDMGQDKLELSELVIAEPNNAIFKNFGTLDINGLKLRVKGSFKSESNAKEIAFEVVMVGRWTEIDFGTWERKKPGEIKLKATLTYYKLTYDGQTPIEIDQLNNVQVIDGVDMLAQRRGILEL